jgi:hypothetical protein
MAGGEVGNLMVLVRRIDGLLAMNPLLGSRAETLLRAVSVCILLTWLLILPVQFRCLASAQGGRTGSRNRCVRSATRRTPFFAPLPC